MRHPLIATSLLVALTAPVAIAKMAAPSASLTAAVNSSTRTEANRARDQYRHPAQTLAFFGVRPTDTVVELWPGGGWYTEVLAPYLAANGKLIVAAPLGRASESIARKLDGDAATYGRVGRATFPSAEGGTPVAPGSADVVLTFRNVHNWRFGGVDAAQAAFDQAFTMLKPGGTLGVVEHRLPEAADAAREEKSGYMKVSSVKAFAANAGFKFVGASEVNANPRDTKDYPKGVWTLPPNYAEKDLNRAKYAAIGESDRMTLKFVKPR